MTGATAQLNYLTMASYSAYVAICQTLAENPSLDTDAAIDLIRKTNHDACALDFGRARILIAEIAPDQMSAGYQENLRNFLSNFIRLVQPWWLRLIPYGREKLRTALDEDKLQCFRIAGLLDAEPSAEAVRWWDEVAALVRGTVDVEKMLSAREAERLSLEFERQRLTRLGIGNTPQWVSLDDNTLGYDILSYDIHNGRIVNRLVEVKSTHSDMIFVTRNEWNNASTADQRYIFHVWKMPEQAVTEFSVAAVRPNIPADLGTGIWQEVRISILQ